VVELEHRIGSSEKSERLNTQHANNAMRKANLSTAMTAFTLSLASLTPSIDDLHAADIFTKVTNGLIVTLAGSGRGCAWGDYNNDGFIDLYEANSKADGRGTTAGADFLFQNNRDGTFTDVRAAARIADPVDSQGCVWADYDNDGHLDLFVSAYFGGNNHSLSRPAVAQTELKST
jgi:hypothetical protein